MFNIFLEILKSFRFIFVLTIFVSWLKIGASTQPEKLKDKLLLSYNLKNRKLSSLVSNTHDASKIAALVSTPTLNEIHLKHIVAKVDKWRFSKNEFFADFNLFTKTNFPEKKIVLIFNQFLVINSLICRTWQQSQMEI